MPPTATPPKPRRGSARDSILDAALHLIRSRGFSATSVEDLCRTAGVTKGAFFHHFESKEALAVAAARRWHDTTAELFAAAAFHDAGTPRERVLAYVDLRERMLTGTPQEFSCVAGTMVQEAYSTTAIRDACADTIFGHAATLEADLRAALDQAGHADIDANGLARHTQAVIQGAFIVAKAADDPSIGAESLQHLGRYLALLLTEPAGTHPERNAA